MTRQGSEQFGQGLTPLKWSAAAGGGGPFFQNGGDGMPHVVRRSKPSPILNLPRPCGRGFSFCAYITQKLAGPQCAAQDGKVAGAAAQIPYQRRPYIAFARLRASPQQRGQRDREARRAIAALKGDLGNESGADRASFGRCIKRFWRNDVGAVDLPSHQQAGIDGMSVHQHQARAATANAACRFDCCQGQCSRNKSTNRASAGTRMVCNSPLRRKRITMPALMAVASSTPPPAGVRARSA
jgi:hypothetical protein